jgi:fused signal recognition particle receptor
MFDFLKKKLSESVDRLAEKIREKQGERKVPQKPVEKPAAKPVESKEGKKPRQEKVVPKHVEAVAKPVSKTEPKVEHKPEKMVPHKEEPKKLGFLKKIIERPAKIPGKAQGEKVRQFGKGIGEMVLEKKMGEKDIDDFFSEIELDLMEANVALEVVDFLRERIKQHLVNKQFKRGRVKESLIEAFEAILMEIFDQGKVDLGDLVKKKKPVCIVFIGFNGSGKTTSIAKLARYLQNRKYKVVLAAGDTFRAASIEQLENHGKRLGVKVIKHEYGADSAAVIFDAVKHAESKGVDFVLADTAGRTHQDKNLMDEIKKVVRVNKPDLKVLVADSLTGNDVIEQAQQFDKAVGIDCMIFTKVDVNQKGGSLLSACYAIKKPILFIGTGQSYDSIEIFEPRKFVKDLMGE